MGKIKEKHRSEAMKTEKCKLYSNKNSTVLVMSPPDTRNCPNIMINTVSSKFKDDYNIRALKISKKFLSKIIVL